MSAGKQIVAVVGMNTQAMSSRLASSLVIVVGMAAVVAVALAIFSMSEGLIQMTKRTTSPDRMSIMALGAIAGGPTAVNTAYIAIIADTPGIKKGSDGNPLLYGVAGGPRYFTRKKQNGAPAPVVFSGVGSNILEVRPETKIIEGRMFTSGLREIIAGKGAAERFENIAVGKVIRLPDGPWTIVGIFDSGGSTSDYLLWADSATMLSAYRSQTFSAIFARLEEGTKAAQDAFKAALKSNPSVQVDVETEEEQRLRGQIAAPIKFYNTVAYWVGGLMGLGTIFAALNTMYAAVAARTVEIATLRAVGFGAMPVVISVLVEALALAVLGAIVGALIAWTVYDGRDQNYQVIAIRQAITPMMVTVAIGVSLLVGLIGAALPAVRAARLPVATALQAR